MHVFEFAPQLEVLQLADCAINHAGINTVNECIHSGVPMLLYPFDFLDQPGTAARVIYHGLEVLGDRRADSPRTIERRIDQVLSDDAMRNRVARMQNKFRAYDLEDSAISAVESPPVIPLSTAVARVGDCVTNPRAGETSDLEQPTPRRCRQRQSDLLPGITTRFEA